MDVKYRKQADKKRNFIISLKTDQDLLKGKFPMSFEMKFFVKKDS